MWTNKQLIEFWKTVGEVEPPMLRLKLIEFMVTPRANPFQPWKDQCDDAKYVTPDESGAAPCDVMKASNLVLARCVPYIEEYTALRDKQRKEEIK